MVTVPPMGQVVKGKGGPLIGAGSPRKGGGGPLAAVPFQSCLYAAASRLKKFPCATFWDAVDCGTVGCDAVCVVGGFCCGGAAGMACACDEGTVHGSSTIARIVAAAPGHAHGFCRFIESRIPLRPFLGGYSPTHKEFIKIRIIFAHR